jgi:hypothetical protein
MYVCGLGEVELKTRDGFSTTSPPTVTNMDRVVKFAPYGIAPDGTDLPGSGLSMFSTLTPYLMRTRAFRKST